MDKKLLQAIRDQILGVSGAPIGDLNTSIYWQQIRDALLGISPARTNGNLDEKIYIQQVRNAAKGLPDGAFGSLRNTVYIQQIINALNNVADGPFGSLDEDTYLEKLLTRTQNPAIYNEFSDSFHFFNLDWIGSGWGISSGSISNTPAVSGNELQTDPGFQAWNDATNLTNWTKALNGGSTINRDADAYVGNYCARITLDASGHVCYLKQNITTVVGQWYTTNIWAKSNPVGGQIEILVDSGVTGNSSMLTLTGSYALYQVTWQAKNTTSAVWLRNNLSASTSLYIGTISTKANNLPSNFRVIKGSSSYGAVSAMWTMPLLAEISGVAMCMDATMQNGVIFWGDRQRMVLSKIVNGTVINLITAADSYFANKNFKIRRKNGTNVFQALYGTVGAEVQVGTDQTITDASIINNKYHGVFSAHPSSSCSWFSFDGPIGATTLQNDWITPGASTPALIENLGVANPIISPAMISDLSNPNGVADPFIVQDSGRYYIFHEIMHTAVLNTPPVLQTLGYSWSDDGVTWHYGSILSGFSADDCPDINPAVLAAPSYPQVFKCDGVWYMLPCLTGTKLYLWKATGFPVQWKYHKELLDMVSVNIADSTVFQFGGLWWISLFDQNNLTNRLFYSPQLYGYGYTEHPSSPILTTQRNSRPAGRPIVRASSVDIFVQDNIAYYGNKTRAYQLTNLTITTITVAELAISPILDASGVVGSWNRYGSHTLDRVNNLLSIVDGESQQAGGYSVGLFKDTP